MSAKRKSPSRPFILGLTGSIGMGKSTTASLFRALSVPVHDSDATVHALYAPGGAAALALTSVFPSAIRLDGSVDRSVLRMVTFENSDAFIALEAIVHPLVIEREAMFLADHTSEVLVVLDIPLLFETGADARCHQVLVVTAPFDVQRTRVLSRDGMTETAFDAILRRQLPDAEKRACADHVIDTSLGVDSARMQVSALVARFQE